MGCAKGVRISILGAKEMKTTRRELSKQLKEAGAKQESESYCMPGFDCSFRSDNRPMKLRPNGWIASFDCHELLERLPNDGSKFVTLNSEGPDGFSVRYQDCAGGKGDQHSEYANTPAEALGKLYLWCLENKHIKKDCEK